MRLTITLTVFSFFFFLGLCGLSVHAQKQGPLSVREMDSMQAIYRSQYLKLTDIKNRGPLFSSGKSILPGPVKKNLEEKILSRPNSICYDTSSRFFIQKDSVVLYSYTPAKTADGHLLISGQYFTPWQINQGGAFLIKTDYYGNTLWTKIYDSAAHTGSHFLNYYKVMELADGSILMAGVTNNRVTQNDDLIITKTDPSGNILWKRIFKSRIWGYGHGSTDYFYVQDMKEDPYTGDLYFCGPHWSAGKALIKINSANGDIIWSNLYEIFNGGYGIFDTPFGLDIRQNEIRYFGKFLYTSGNAGLISILRINKQTGDTIQFKIFKSADTAGYKVDFLTADKMTVLNNGHYAVSGECYGSYVGNWNGSTPLIQAAVAEFDSSLNFVRAYAFRNPIQSNQYNTRATVFPDGSGLFSMLKWYGGFTADIYYVQFINGQIIKQRKKFYTNEGMPYENLAVKTQDGADMIVRLLGDSIANIEKNEFIKLHLSDTSSACLGVDDFQTTVYPFQYVPFSWLYDSTGYNVFLENPNKTLITQATNLNLLPGCFQVSHCDTLKLTASDTAICMSQPLTITIHKNQDCGSLVPLIYDTTAVNSVIQLNDSTFMFYFNIPWSGYIYGSLQGCTLLKDSVHIHVLQAPATLNLGPDTLICPNNIIILNAHSGYVSYLWQDGSTDSIYTVTQPGVYFVNTRDACGGMFSDTVIVLPHPPVPLSIGADRTLCNGDTLHLDAPSGFINYTWSPDYNISSTTTQNVVVSPAIDTAYSLKAEKTTGCFAFDTVRITVYQAPSIQLGADRGFCAGDSAVLNAGTGFSSYQWSSGQSSQQIIVYTTGNYSVTGTTLDGCHSYDTLRILNVYPLPVILLDHDSTLCSGDNRVLNAGTGYVSYQWNNGQAGSSITVNTPGVYGVSVIDIHGCTGTDTTRITKMLPLPVGFLPADTAICNYGTMQLNAAGSFNSYTWNNSSTGPSITISQPGWYWLQVRDRDNCIGRDSILVNPKECLKGLYVPTGFTPNNDGKNDLFRPILLGNVKVYQFWIYNRWGQIVFQSTDLSRGWDGTVGGLPQDNRLFIWMCRYQLDGEPLKMAKGTLIIIR